MLDDARPHRVQASSQREHDGANERAGRVEEVEDLLGREADLGDSRVDARELRERDERDDGVRAAEGVEHRVLRAREEEEEEEEARARTCGDRGGVSAASRSVRFILLIVRFDDATTTRSRSRRGAHLNARVVPPSLAPEGIAGGHRGEEPSSRRRRADRRGVTRRVVRRRAFCRATLRALTSRRADWLGGVPD